MADFSKIQESPTKGKRLERVIISSKLIYVRIFYDNALHGDDRKLIVTHFTWQPMMSTWLATHGKTPLTLPHSNGHLDLSLFARQWC